MLGFHKFEIGLIIIHQRGRRIEKKERRIAIKYQRLARRRVSFVKNVRFERDVRVCVLYFVLINRKAECFLIMCSLFTYLVVKNRQAW